MLDPRVVAVVIRRKEDWVPEDKTLEISEYEPRSDRVRVRFSGSKGCPFGWERVTILERPAPVSLEPGAMLFVDGSPEDATEAYLFTGPPEAGSCRPPTAFQNYLDHKRIPRPRSWRAVGS